MHANLFILLAVSALLVPVVQNPKLSACIMQRKKATDAWSLSVGKATLTLDKMSDRFLCNVAVFFLFEMGL